MRQTLHADAAALDAVLARHGFMAIGDCPLFRLIQNEQAAVLFDNLARHAIPTRPFDYNSRWLRLGLPASDQAHARLDQALRDGDRKRVVQGKSVSVGVDLGGRRISKKKKKHVRSKEKYS